MSVEPGGGFRVVNLGGLKAVVHRAIWEEGDVDFIKAESEARLRNAMCDRGLPEEVAQRAPLKPWMYHGSIGCFVLEPEFRELRVAEVKVPSASNKVERKAWLLGIADAVSLAADCSRRKVGALIVDPKTWHILATGYNGRPPGLPGCASAGACPRAQSTVESRSSYVDGPGRCDAWHAEDNALRRLGFGELRERAIGGWAVVTYEPCDGCYALLRHYGIIKVIWPGGERDL